jgi:hypothetical protein
MRPVPRVFRQLEWIAFLDPWKRGLMKTQRLLYQLKVVMPHTLHEATE